MESSMFQSLVSSLPLSVYFKIFDGTDFLFSYVNEVKAQNSGVKAEEMIGKKDSDFMPFEEAMLAYDEDMRAYNGEIVNEIRKVTRIDGSTAYVSIKKSQRKDEQGNIIGILGITEDITRRMEIEELVKVEVHSILHEIQRILTGHGGFMGLITSLLKKGKVEKCLTLIPPRAAESLSFEEQVTKMTLRMAQLGLEKPELPEMETEFDLRWLFDKLVNRHCDRMQKLGIQWDDFMGLIPQGKYTLKTVLNWLAFAIDSVIDNQIKYGEIITKMTFGAEIDKQQQQLIINVSSNGVRINEEFAKTKLFKKGQRAKDTCYKQGTGFGLYTAREYIRSLGGEMEYVPVVADEWMGFIIILPLNIVQNQTS